MTRLPPMRLNLSAAPAAGRSRVSIWARYICPSATVASTRTWSMLTYKAERHGMVVALQEESYTSKTCPVCGHRRKSKVQGRVFHCTNKQCGFTWHRDGVGACNIRRKYLDLGPVVGAMAPPTGMR